jgi:predicted negative regulator of RcsB-dependent stress response
MATHISRKALKEDAFRDSMFWALDWAYQRRRTFIVLGSALLAVIVAGAGYLAYDRSQRRAQSERFYHIERGPEQAGLSAEERQARARKGFEAFAAEFPGSHLAPVAWMHVAGIAWEQGDLDGAGQAFRAVLAHGASNPALRDLAHIGLGKLDEAQGRLDAAAAQYEAVSDAPFDELKALSLGRVAAARQQDEEARRHFEKAARAGSGSILAEWARQNLDYHP